MEARRPFHSRRLTANNGARPHNPCGNSIASRSDSLGPTGPLPPNEDTGDSAEEPPCLCGCHLRIREMGIWGKQHSGFPPRERGVRCAATGSRLPDHAAADSWADASLTTAVMLSDTRMLRRRSPAWARAAPPAAEALRTSAIPPARGALVVPGGSGLPVARVTPSAVGFTHGVRGNAQCRLATSSTRTARKNAARAPATRPPQSQNPRPRHSCVALSLSLSHTHTHKHSHTPKHESKNLSRELAGTELGPPPRARAHLPRDRSPLP
mmetsp:Transcript_12763/g.31738  ORF Transcript_12763/g.31738 Transcript_12763/m.31738 type:complete len:267 (-) Transcript_12763:2653-3453(-)